VASDSLNEILRTLEDLRHKIQTAKDEEDMCKICFARPQNTVFVPCGHLAQCEECTLERMKSSQNCDYCREPIVQIVKVYRN
jgi:hypothetical protein